MEVKGGNDGGPVALGPLPEAEIVAKQAAQIRAATDSLNHLIASAHPNLVVKIEVQDHSVTRNTLPHPHLHCEISHRLAW